MGSSVPAEKGAGLWIRVPGNCGLGRRVGASSACMNKSLLIFGGCRGVEDGDSNNSKSGSKDKTLLKDARHVDVDRLLELNVAGEKDSSSSNKK